MLKLLLLVPLVGVIVKTAGGRGVPRWLAGTVAVVGYLLLDALELSLDQRSWHEPFYGRSVANGGTGMAYDVAVLAAPWLWLGVVFVYIRFIHGHRHPHPDGRWKCPECGWLNDAAFFQCEACKREFCKG